MLAKGTPIAGEVVDPGDAKKVLLVKVNKTATFKLSTVEAAGGSKLTVRASPPHTEKADRAIELQGSKTKEVLAPAGTEYTAYVENDQTVTIKH